MSETEHDVWPRVWSTMAGADLEILRSILRSVVMTASDNGMSNAEIAAELERLAGVVKAIDAAVGKVIGRPQ